MIEFLAIDIAALAYVSGGTGDPKVSLPKQEQPPRVLGFNEPDVPGQSNMNSRMIPVGALTGVVAG